MGGERIEPWPCSVAIGNQQRAAASRSGEGRAIFGSVLIRCARHEQLPEALHVDAALLVRLEVDAAVLQQLNRVLGSARAGCSIRAQAVKTRRKNTVARNVG